MADLPPVRSTFQVLAEHGDLLFGSLSTEGEPGKGEVI